MNLRESAKRIAGAAADGAVGAATDVPAIVVVICFTICMCSFASDLKDGSELTTTAVATTGSFFLIAGRYAFKGKR